MRMNRVLKRRWLAAAFGALPLIISSPAAPTDELRLELNRYADNFGLEVLYPALSVQKQLSPTTELSARYVVDAITSASMKSRLEVDGITSATRLSHGGSTGAFDEVRQEVGLGLSRSGRAQTLSGTMLHSREHDYRSLTLTTQYRKRLALGNSEASLSLLRSWDDVSPVTRRWIKRKNTTKASLGWTQVLSRRSIVQAVYTHTVATGFLSSPYQVVTIIDGDNLQTHYLETLHPSRRDRNALRVAFKQKLSRAGVLEAGYRRYWDSWAVEAHDVELGYTHRLGDVPLGLSLRRYTQSRAEFFRSRYDGTERYRSVDLRLDSGHSTQVEIHGSLPGPVMRRLGLTTGEHLQVDGSVVYYRRVTSTRDWHRRSDTLVSMVTHLGVRYRF